MCAPASCCSKKPLAGTRPSQTAPTAHAGICEQFLIRLHTECPAYVRIAVQVCHHCKYRIAACGRRIFLCVSRALETIELNSSLSRIRLSTTEGATELADPANCCICFLLTSRLWLFSYLISYSAVLVTFSTRRGLRRNCCLGVSTTIPNICNC